MAETATDFGTDIRMDGGDLPLAWSMIDGFDNLGQALANRLSTPRGSLDYDQNYGWDLRDLINAAMTPAERSNAKSAITAEVEKDPRVHAASIGLDLNLAARAGTVSIECDTEDGPFSLVLAITDLSVTLLTQQGVSDVAVANTPIAVGPPGPPGPQGRTGPSGGGAGASPDGGDLEIVSDGNETVVFQRVYDFGLFSSGTLAAEMMASAKAASGTATLRLRVGGSRNAADGTTVATATRTNTAFGKVSASGSFTNPTGLQYVKITLQNSVVDSDATAADFSIDVR